MSWRIHLTNQAIQTLHILPGKPPLLMAWTQRDRATYFDLESGVEVGEHQHTAVSRQSDKWAAFIASLVAPNSAFLPYVRTAQSTMFTTNDGKLRLYWMADDELLLELDGKEVKLELKTKVNLVALGLDRILGVIAALDSKGKLHIAQQHITVGAFDMKLKFDTDSQPSLAVANGGSAIYVSDGQEIILADNSGKVKKRQPVHYFIGRMVCSPDGKRLVTSDPETGVIRVYDDDLLPTHQRHALDLLQDAAQLQLIADLPPFNAAPGSIVIDDKGHLAFNISGVVCLTDLKEMDALPRPQPLL
ncbi:MAG: hypothetical protein R3E39_14440 [Anaerolineae bacterium]